jgi:transcriptional regulator with XRE-family HTH domain
MGLDSIERVIGRQLASARKRAGWSQAELGEAVGRFTGKPWSRQTVANAEGGQRGFTASDVWVLSFALDIAPSALIVPDVAMGTVEVSGVPVRAHRFRRFKAQQNGWTEEAMVGASKVVERVGAAMESLDAIARHEIPDVLATMKAVKAEGEQLKRLAGSERKRKERKA